MMGYPVISLLLFLLHPIQQSSLTANAEEAVENLKATATAMSPSMAAPPTAPAGEGEPHASLTVHALNVVTGIPAAGLVVRFMELEDPKKSWIELMNSTTNVDGRLDKSSLTSLRLKAGTYKLRFETGEYWQQQGHHSFYPYVEVVFTITEEEQKVHIPLLMSPYSYTTYRGN
nr:5-hydroxyisourate hydrolase-like isoform X1 [Anolis sagrei ordinatus]